MTNEEIVEWCINTIEIARKKVYDVLEKKPSYGDICCCDDADPYEILKEGSLGEPSYIETLCLKCGGVYDGR